MNKKSLIIKILNLVMLVVIGAQTLSSPGGVSILSFMWIWVWLLIHLVTDAVNWIFKEVQNGKGES